VIVQQINSNIQPGLEIKSFRPTTDLQQQMKTTEEVVHHYNAYATEQEEALELRIRNHIFKIVQVFL